MLSASRLAIAFQTGPGARGARPENLRRHTIQGPYLVCPTASPESPTYALGFRKDPLVSCYDTGT